MKKILIAAQYYRVGSTLVQRCIHQCDDTVIYGEMNNLLNICINLDKMGTFSPLSTKTLPNKKENWANKIDDDYSLCYDQETMIKLSRSLITYVLKADSENKDKNVGFKCIAPLANELAFALCSGFSIIYLTRDIKDAIYSYLSQPWNQGINMFATVVQRSETVTKEFREWAKHNYEGQFYELDYKDIHTKIADVISDLGLSIQSEKLQSILNNKVNSGY